MSGAVLESVAPGGWRPAVAEALAGGARFAGAWASGDAWRACLVAPDAVRVLSCEVPGRRPDTIVDLVPAADWDEREAQDLHGLSFSGHDPARALADHTDDLQAWTTPVTGDGAHQVAVGPIHAGVIESGHFRFHVVGDRILAMDPRLFYKHRGLERAAEGLAPDRALAHVQRACAACSVANTVAFAQAIEAAAGLWPDRDLRVGRTLALELERLYNHLHDIGAICAGVGFAPGTMAFAALKERAQRLIAGLAGHRFLFGSVAIGLNPLVLDADAARAAGDAVRELRGAAAAAWRELEFAGSVQARLDGVGRLERDDARRLGAVGPAARASGLHEDVRDHSPRLWYDGFAAATLAEPAGDVAARLRIRAAELEATCELLDDLLARPVGPGGVTETRARAALGVGRVECPRGATTCAVELDGDRAARVHLRTASYANWPALAHAAAGELLPDFPLINKSFELCYACVDR